MNAVVRPADSRPDLEAAGRLFAEYGRHLGAHLCSTTLEAEIRGLPGAYAPPQGGLWLAWAGSEPTGCIALRAVDGATAEIKRLYVAPESRRKGLGRALLDAALAGVRERGYRRAVLETMPEFTEAMALYRAAGFRVVRAGGAGEPWELAWDG